MADAPVDNSDNQLGPARNQNFGDIHQYKIFHREVLRFFSLEGIWLKNFEEKPGYKTHVSELYLLILSLYHPNSGGQVKLGLPG